MTTEPTTVNIDDGTGKDPSLDWVKMEHPEITDAEPAVALREAFTEVWEPKGWKLAGESAAPSTSAASGKSTPAGRAEDKEQ